ncbi:MAG: hypothetical protein ACXWQR_07825 [Ktedonobacterales bacterium]
MPDVLQPSVRIQRVTTRRRSLRTLQCPLEPELLVAEFAGELPPDVALAVREHIAVCETCGARSQALRAPYELLSSLGHEPVATVPDLRDTVRKRAGRGRLYRGTLRVAAAIGRGGAIGMAGAVGIAALVALLVVGVLFSVNAYSVSRSANRLNGVPAAASSGMLLALTDKLIAVTGSDGQNWQVAEVIAVDEQSGVVQRSLPTAIGLLRFAGKTDMPMAASVSPDGRTIYEVTAPDANGRQALVAFDSSTGDLRFATMLTQPGATSLPAGVHADALAISGDGAIVYVGLHVVHPAADSVRALAVNGQTGAIRGGVRAQFTRVIPAAPPAGSLPVSAFPTAVPHIDASSFNVTQGANDGLALTADGRWLFDVLLISDYAGHRYAVVRRIDTSTGLTVQELALSGDFTLSQLVMGGVSGSSHGASTTSPQSHLYLLKGSPDAQCFVLDSGVNGPTLLGFIALGGPAAPPNIPFSGTLSISPAADGTHVFMTQDATAADGAITGHDLWLVDTRDMTVVSHRSDDNSADAVLANSSTDQNAQTFLLRGGTVLLVSPDLGGAQHQWLSLSDGHPVIQLIGTISG